MIMASPGGLQPVAPDVRSEAASTVMAIWRHSGVPLAGSFKAIEALSTWRSFPLQQQAFEFISTQSPAHQKHLRALRYFYSQHRVCSQEQGNNGKRQFVAGTAYEAWRQICKTPPAQRHFYEIIKAHQPCHLYFDIEFDLAANRLVDGNAQVQLLVHEVACLLKERFNITMSPDRHAIELDSTTPTKFSRHVIVQLRRAWAHNGHVHAFVSLLLERLTQKRASEAGLRGDVTCTPHDGSDVPGSATEQPPHVASTSPVPCATYADFWVNKPSQPPPQPQPDLSSKQGIQALEPQLCAEQSEQRHDVPGQVVGCQQQVLLIDTAVYTRNRAFRMYASSKWGKPHTLRATRRFAVARMLSELGTSPPAPVPAGSHNASTGAMSKVSRGTAGQIKRAKAQDTDITPDVLELFGISPAALRPATHCNRRLPPATSSTTGTATGNQHSTSTQEQHVTGVIGVCSNGNSLSHPAAGQQCQASNPGPAKVDALHCVSSPPAPAQPLAAASLLLSRGEEEAVAERVFFASLVTHTRMCEAVPPLRMFAEHEAALHTGMIKLPGSTEHRPPPSGTRHQPGAAASPGTDVGSAHRATFTRGPTPWPPLNQYVEAMCAQAGSPGRVSGWCVLGGCDGMAASTNAGLWVNVNIQGNRFCGNVQREHRSNGVYWVIDIRDGTWVQRCFDPDCKAYKSPALPLPQDVWQLLLWECSRHSAGVGQLAEGHSDHS